MKDKHMGNNEIVIGSRWRNVNTGEKGTISDRRKPLLRGDDVEPEVEFEFRATNDVEAYTVESFLRNFVRVT